jgi:hypothetical protein
MTTDRIPVKRSAVAREELMTALDFRELALSLPGAEESSHMGHPDFRAKGKIFATLGYPDQSWGMVKLTPAQQKDFVRAEPDMFVPMKGGWGTQGATSVCLENANGALLRRALLAAWKNVIFKATSKKKAPQRAVKKKSENKR